MPQNDQMLTITLTGRHPVRIKKEEWPIIASAEEKHFDTEVEYQANRSAVWKLFVRQHSDGRAIVYAIHTYATNHKSDSCRDVRGGELLNGEYPHDPTDSGDIARLRNMRIAHTIKRVGDEIESRLPSDGMYGSGVFPRLVHECIADLPAEELE